MALSHKQELFCWLAGTVLALGVFMMSHTFHVTTVTFLYGIALFAVIALLFWMRFRKRRTPEPRWLRTTANLILVILSVIFVLYLLGVATWYE